MDQPGLQNDTSPPKSSRRKGWILFFLLALLLHALLFSLHVSFKSPERPTPVEIEEFDPSRLNALREKWKQKPLLLNQDDSLPREKTPPPNARYDSDRNTTVEREQKSAYSSMLPVPGPVGPAPAAPGAKPRSQAPQKTAPAKSAPQTAPNLSQSLPNLGNLGIAFHIKDHPLEPPRQGPNERSAPTPTYGSGKDQALLDDTLITAAETMLNTQESNFYSYYKRVIEAVGPLWNSKLRELHNKKALKPGRYLTSYEAILDLEGRLLEIRFHRRSQDPDFDQTVEAAWQKIAQFHNPPKGLIESDNRVHLPLTFFLDVSEEASRAQFAW